MTDHRMLWKDVIHLTDNGSRFLAANVLNYLSISLENVINFNVDFHIICWIDNKQLSPGL